MTKPIVIADFAYKSPKRTGRGTGRAGLKATLCYLQYRDQRNNQLAKNRRHERWQDRGLGVHHREILNNCLALQSKHVLAWTWVISPAPDLMELVPPRDRRALLYELTDRVVEDYYTERGFDVPEYAFVMHAAATQPKDGEPPREHLHTHVVLPGTAPLPGVDRAPVYNNKEKGHDALFRDLAAQHFAELLDERGIDWRQHRTYQPQRDEHGAIDLDDFFAR